MHIYLKTISVPIIKRELRNYEMRLEDVKKNIEWKQSHSTPDNNHKQYIDAELAKIDDTLAMCHEKVVEIKLTFSQEARDSIMTDIQFYLSDLNQKISQMENYSEDFSRHSDYIGYL